MEYENMRMPELKSLARDRGLRNYSRLRKAELVALFDHLDWNYCLLCGAKTGPLKNLCNTSIFGELPPGPA